MGITKEYLAGLFDGEGSASLILTVSKQGRSLRPEITITQKTMWYLEVLSQGLRDLGLGHNLSSQRYRGVGRIMISGLKRSDRFIQVVGPYVILKKRQLDLLAGFIQKRLALPVCTPYDKADLDLRQQIRALRNSQGILRDLTSGSPPDHAGGDDKVQTAAANVGGRKPVR
ncbi:MAG TPA: hypothetical protein VH643_03445 [Gemmataceae bacterium]|jgi:hypothetical protein